VNFPFYIARRYLVSKKTRNMIHIISLVSVLGVAVGTMALVIVLSVFNGFEELVISLYNSFDPSVKITVSEGKSFRESEIPMQKIKAVSGVMHVALVAEENALVKYRDKQYIATLKGVSQEYSKTTGLDTLVAEGSPVLERGRADFAIVGQGVAYSLGLILNDNLYPLTVYVPGKGNISVTDPESAFHSDRILPSAIFSVQQDFDSRYMIVPLRFLRRLLNDPERLTALELKISDNVEPQMAVNEIQRIVGSRFKVQDRYSQHEFLYKIMNSEKYAVFLILSFIIIIAAFNIVSSLTMLILEKKKDIGILWSMGATHSTLRRIFVWEGLLVTGVGVFVGLALGITVCLLQQHLGIVKLGGSGTFVIDAYPVQIEIPDIVYVMLVVFLIGSVAAWFPSRKLIRPAAVTMAGRENT
jgi:lipoprotein-releasing system permease protein